MASLRGQQKIWDNAVVNPASAPTITSPVVIPGSGAYVSIYIQCDQTSTFAIEVGVNPTGVESGRNAVNASALPDYGLLWFPYTRLDSASDVTIAVTANAPVAVDLSPFGPQYLRLRRTDNGTSGHVTAYATAFGPN